MSAQDVKEYLKALQDQPLESLWIYGGEPFLYKGVLTEVLKIARRRGIARIGVLTNAYWAKTLNLASKTLSFMKRAGLNAIVISTDGFHDQCVPLDYAINAALAAEQIGIEEVSYSISFLQPRKRANPFNERSETIWSRLNEDNGFPLCEETVLLLGRAVDRLLDYCEPKKIDKRMHCRLPGYIGGTFKQPQGLQIDPNGWAMICPGLSLGNAKAHTLADLVKRYDDPENSFWQAIRQKGPKAMVELARERGYAPGDRYASVCHLCYEARLFLRPYFPDYLAPGDCYGEPTRSDDQER